MYVFNLLVWEGLGAWLHGWSLYFVVRIKVCFILQSWRAVPRFKNKLPSWTGVDNYNFFSQNEGLTLEPTPPSFTTCQGQNYFTSAHQILVSKISISSMCISPSLSMSSAIGPKRSHFVQVQIPSMSWNKRKRNCRWSFL